jgi:hypothetical protein
MPDDEEKGANGPCRGADQTLPPRRPQGRSGKNLPIDVDGRGACGSVPNPIVRVEQKSLQPSLQSQLYIASNI